MKWFKEQCKKKRMARHGTRLDSREESEVRSSPSRRTGYKLHRCSHTALYLTCLWHYTCLCSQLWLDLTRVVSILDLPSFNFSVEKHRYKSSPSLSNLGDRGSYLNKRLPSEHGKCHTDKVNQSMSLKSIKLSRTAQSDNNDVSVVDSMVIHWIDIVDNLSIS